jgi:Ca2+-binding RTX toxin-like protein
LDGGDGDDELFGGDGNDRLIGGDGNDVINSGDGDDTLDGGSGADVLVGGLGDDTILGGSGDDILDGGDGDDTIDGEAGDDLLFGGSGSDTFIQNFNDVGDNTIADFNPDEDTIDFSGLGGIDELSVTKTDDGGTRIDGGNGSTLTINGVTPDQLAGSVTIDGEPVSGNGNFNLQASLQSAVNANAAADALGGALDGAAQQGGAPADSADDTDGRATGADIVAGEDQEDAGDGDELADGGGG